MSRRAALDLRAQLLRSSNRLPLSLSALAYISLRPGRSARRRGGGSAEDLDDKSHHGKNGSRGGSQPRGGRDEPSRDRGGGGGRDFDDDGRSQRGFGHKGGATLGTVHVDLTPYRELVAEQVGERERD